MQTLHDEAGFSKRLTEQLAYVRSGEVDLTQRQLAVLLLICETSKILMVRDIARMLDVAKPVVTRAVVTLAGHGFACKRRDFEDRRDMAPRPTEQGHAYVQRLARLGAITPE